MRSFERIVTVTLNPAVDRVIEVPDLRIGAHQRGRLVSRTPAGKAVNVARALSRLGVPALATGFVGEDCFDEFEASLTAASVASQFLMVDSRTRENITLVDPATGQDTHIRDVGITVTPAEVARMERKLNLLGGPGSLLIFAGSMPNGISPGDFRRLVASALRSGAAVAVDTSGQALRAVGDLPLWLVKPNREELSALLGRPIASDDEIIGAGRTLSERIQSVIVSCGAAGGYVFVNGSALAGQVDLGGATVVNTVGCGDCMLAGFVAARTHGTAVREAYRDALAVATAAAVSVRPGEFDLEAAARFRAATHVEPITD